MEQICGNVDWRFVESQVSSVPLIEAVIGLHIFMFLEGKTTSVLYIF